MGDVFSRDFVPPPPDHVKPTLSRERLARDYPGYVGGSATGEVDHWRKRALAAEGELARLRRLYGLGEEAPVR